MQRPATHVLRAGCHVPGEDSYKLGGIPQPQYPKTTRIINSLGLRFTITINLRSARLPFALTSRAPTAKNQAAQFQKRLPSRELTYPTLGKENHLKKGVYNIYTLFPRRVSLKWIMFKISYTSPVIFV